MKEGKKRVSGCTRDTGKKRAGVRKATAATSAGVSAGASKAAAKVGKAFSAVSNMFGR